MKKLNLLAVCLVMIAIFSITGCTNAKSQEPITSNNSTSTASQPAQVTEVRASHILVKTKEEAEKLMQDITAGQSFEKLAEQNSLCPSGKQGGDLGFFGRGMMVPEFENVAFSSPVGQVSQPVQTQFGWHLVKVTETK